MKKTILVYGSISGAIVAAFMLVAVTLGAGDTNYTNGMYIGFAGMLLAFSMIFFGIKSFRDRLNNGTATFWQALKAGLGIMLIASTVYVLVWLIYYHIFIPNFYDTYSDQMINKVKAATHDPAALELQLKSLEGMREMYRKPWFVILVTYMEILPLGILFALVAALIMKRKPQDPDAATAQL